MLCYEQPDGHNQKNRRVTEALLFHPCSGNLTPPAFPTCSLSDYPRCMDDVPQSLRPDPLPTPVQQTAECIHPPIELGFSEFTRGSHPMSLCFLESGN